MTTMRGQSSPRVCRCRWFMAVLVTAVAILAAPPSLPAQAVLSGHVTDTAGVPVFGARVTVDGTAAEAQTDATGRFRFVSVPAGRLSVTVMRLGFLPFNVAVHVDNASAEINVRMIPVAATLPRLTVRPDRMRYTGRLAGYYRRLESKSSGYFITREDIDRENPSTTGQLLRRVPAITVVRGRGGITGIRMRGRKCWPLVWIDGMPMPAGEVDLDAFVPSSIQGIELYLGATTAPMAYVLNEALSSCGTILIWSRGPDTDPLRSVAGRSRDFEELLSERAVYTSQNVDRTARLDSTRVLDVTFPPALFASRTPGLVIAEFVVDTLGRVEENTVGVVSSTAPLFTDAVRAALATAAFIPAVKDGRTVRQLVQQPFEFEIGKSSRHPTSLKQ
jgi:TonB family protein